MKTMWRIGLFVIEREAADLHLQLELLWNDVSRSINYDYDVEDDDDHAPYEGADLTQAIQRLVRLVKQFESTVGPSWAERDPIYMEAFNFIASFPM